MARAVPEWVGKREDTPVPPHVRMRVFALDGGVCQCGCGIVIRPGMSWQTDHVRAIINGGENRESNLRTLLTSCHKRKTGEDVAEKSAVARIAKKHAGLVTKSRRPISGRGFQRSERMAEKTPKADALRRMREARPARIGAFKVKPAPKKRPAAKRRGKR